MDVLFFIIIAIIFFGFFGDGKKKKTKAVSRGVLSPKGAAVSSSLAEENYPRDWENYEAAERDGQVGMQEDLDPAALYHVSKNRMGLARKAAAEKLSDSLQSFETTAKSSQTGGVHVAKQPPLIRDMNMSRKLFLSGGRKNIFGERQKKSFGIKTILAVIALGVVGLYLIGALSA